MNTLLGRGVGMFVFVGGVGLVAIGDFDGTRVKYGCVLGGFGARVGLRLVVGFVAIGDFEGATVKYGCVFGGFGAGVVIWDHNATFCSIISPPLKFRHTVSPVSGLNELSASGLMRSPFKDVSPFHFSLSL